MNPTGIAETIDVAKYEDISDVTNNDVEIKEERDMDDNDRYCDIKIKEEFPTTNVITVCIKKKKGAPRRSEPFHLYTPELFQSIFGFSIYQCHGDPEWSQVLKKKAGTLHFKSNGTRIRDSVPVLDVKPLRVNQSRGERRKKKKTLDASKKNRNKIQKSSRTMIHIQPELFNVKVESLGFQVKEENRNPLDYVSRCIGMKPFQCNLCNLCFKEKRGCKNHIEQVHFKIRLHKCDLCDTTFYSSAGIKKHFEAVHLKLKPYTCDKCKTSFSTTNSLKRHMTTHEKTGRYKCPTCGKKIRHSTTFQEHLDIHNGVKYTCVKCDESYSSKKSLRYHMLKHDPQFSPKISCLKCNKFFINSADLKKHERAVHPTTTYPCSICKKTFALPINLRKHMSTVHDNTDKIFKCEHCKASFKNELYLDQHIKQLHTFAFTCAHCSKKFTNKQRLAYHLNRYHASTSKYKPYRCNRCKKRFITYNHVKRHMKSHMREKPVINANLSCGKCGKKYKLKIALVKHELTCK